MGYESNKNQTAISRLLFKMAQAFCCFFCGSGSFESSDMKYIREFDLDICIEDTKSKILQFTSL